MSTQASLPEIGTDSQNNDPEIIDYAYGYCGMPCALCTRYHTQGSSRCPGCSHNGYYTDMCKVYHCCRERGLEHCGECGLYPCERLGKMGDFRDLNTGHVKPRTCSMVKENGFIIWYKDYQQRASLLAEALEKYNDGRMKRFLCETFIQRDLSDLQELMRQATTISGTGKEVGKAFRALVQGQVLSAQ